MRPVWPALPYKGLGLYGPGDVPIFAGRTTDVRRCARLLGLGTTRILTLHGSTGCGKSSFLRAGLIPFLEARGHGFEFLKKNESASSQALFVRSFDRPLARLADTLFDFVTTDYVIQTPDGPETLHLADALLQPGPAPSVAPGGLCPPKLGPVKLSEAILDIATRADSQVVDGEVAALTVQVLTKLASLLPRTLVLVLDQAEEVLTLKPGGLGEKGRAELFDFLSLFSKLNIDLKLVIALRTEYYGRFIYRLRYNEIEGTNIRDYLLYDVNERELREAIEQPTLKKDVLGYGAPWDQYHFHYEPALLDRIVQDLIHAPLEGGLLPVMQIVCGRLYKKTKKAEPWTITLADYDDLCQEGETPQSAQAKLDGLVGQIDGHLEEVLLTVCEQHHVPAKEQRAEIDRWRELLCSLVRKHVDGTVTTEIHSKEELLKMAREELKCVLDFDVVMGYLAQDQQRIVREAEKPVRGVSTDQLQGDQKIVVYSLGHDAIGLALTNWALRKNSHGLTEEQRRRFRIVGYSAFVFGLISMGTGYFNRGEMSLFLFLYGAMFMLYGSLFLFWPERINLFLRPWMRRADTSKGAKPS
jgi:hypothetical protein